MAEKIGTDRKRSRLDEARSQLTRVVAAMPEDCSCNLIVYSTIAKGVWDRLRPAKPQHKQELQKWVDGLKIGGSTNIFDALELAFHDPEVDTIYLLSDGQPSSGAIVNMDALADEVRRWNHSRQIVIHCISIGEESPLFKRLAAESGGQYRFVR